ncbi:MAG: hypothetical protein GY835_11310 [bacterium]|nr:hypothetical protein [bacterium]
MAEEDYLPVAATLSWEDGDGASKIVEIPLLPSSGGAEEKLFLVRLRSPIGGAVLAEPHTATVVIRAPDAIEIPALTPWMLGLLALLLVVAGWRHHCVRAVRGHRPPNKRRP